jgi:uncharacterized delta-60 repeat protein
MIYHPKHLKFLLFTILFFAAVTEIFAAAGELDLSFGVDGTVNTDNNSDAEAIFDLAVQPDGKIIAIGVSVEGNSSSTLIQRTVIVRYNPNGSIDSTFGASGKVIIRSIIPAELDLQPNGKIVFVGTSGEFPNNDFYVGRLNSDGSFDTTFNGTGVVIPDLRGTADNAYSVQIQPDGKIVVGGISSRGGSFSPNDHAVVRFNANGSLDTTFGNDGKVFTEIALGSQYVSFSTLVIQPDGKIVTVGNILTYNSSGESVIEEFLIVRYNSNGSLDTAFDGDGIVFTQLALPGATRTDAYANSVVLQRDGKIVVVGTASKRNPDGVRLAAVVRYNADGSLDSSFGNGGKALISFSPFTGSGANDVAIQGDDKIVIAGFGGNNNEQYQAVARLNANGSLDTTFSGDGFNVIVSERRYSPAYATAIQPDGKILIGGSIGANVGSDFMLARFEASTCTTNCPTARREKVADFDGDGKTDLSVFHNGTWFINPSGANNPNSFYGVQFGLNADYLTPADFDDDGKTDIAVWRVNSFDSAGYFHIMRSSTNTIRYVNFGRTGDDPRVVGDWDGDGRADLAVYRSGTIAAPQSFFFYRPSSQPSVDFVKVFWGTAGDEPVRGDFDGDGRMDAAVFRPSDGIWYILQSSNNQPRYERWGLASDRRVSGDFDGDGKSDLAVYRDGLWAVLQSSNNQPRYEHWGLSSDRLVAGDYDGDGRTDFAVWRAGVYYILHNSNSQVVYKFFGVANDIPIASAFVR